MVKESKKITALIIVLFLLAGCANQLPPGGGPNDTVPPEIIFVYPEIGTVNFKDDYIEFGFSEYVDKRSFKEALFISPSIDGDLELSWSSTYCRIYFPQKLKADITYTVTIGTDVLDYNNKNRMAEAFNLVFATGEKIDNRSIQGNIFADKPNGVMLFAYRIDERDTINPSKNKPDYVSQSGEFGQYSIAGLAQGNYRVFAVKDEFKDFLFQAEQDLIGIPSHDVYLAAEDTLFSGLNFQLTKIDTLKPRLLSAIMTDRNHILINFSEEVNIQELKSDNFYLVDSTNQLSIKLSKLFKGRVKPTELVLTLADSIIYENRIFLIAEKFSDINKNVTEFDFAGLTTNDLPDTTSINLLRVVPERGNDQVDFLNTKILFSFDDAFDIEIAKNGISFADTSKNEIEFNLEKIDDASFHLIPTQKLKPQTYYRIFVDLNFFLDDAKNSLDSIYQYGFKTFNGQDFTALSGKVVNIDLSQNPILILEEKGSRAHKYELKLKSEKFEFNRVKPGEYKISCYYDTNEDGKYSYGFPFPYEPAEMFFVSTADLTLPPRWAVTDFEFILK